MDWNFSFYWQYFALISDGRNDFEYRLSRISEKCREKLVKFRQYIGLINRWKNGEIFWGFSFWKFWKFPDLNFWASIPQTSLLFLYYHFIFNTFHIYLINPIFKNYYHFTLKFILYLSFQFYLKFKCFYFKILKI